MGTSQSRVRIGPVDRACVDDASKCATPRRQASACHYPRGDSPTTTATTTKPRMLPLTCFIRIALSSRAATASILDESRR